jgi:DNA replication protein DnaC
MNYLDSFSRSKSLNLIPSKKLELFIKPLNDKIKSDRFLKIKYNRFAEANIPTDYWNVEMNSSTTDERLLKFYSEYIKEDLKESYSNGKSICFAGSYGTGKTTLVTNILKVGCIKGFSCLYTTLSDIVSVLTQAPNDEKFLARKELMMVDFLVIDEFDSRFFTTENTAELYSKTLETIFRTRAQNKIPTLMCSNSPKIISTLKGDFQQSLESLFAGHVTTFLVSGRDMRK